MYCSWMRDGDATVASHVHVTVRILLPRILAGLPVVLSGVSKPADQDGDDDSKYFLFVICRLSFYSYGN